MPGGFAKQRVQKARFLQAFQLLRGNLLLSTIMWRSQVDGFSAALLAVLGVILEKSHDSWTWRAQNVEKSSWTKDWSKVVMSTNYFQGFLRNWDNGASASFGTVPMNLPFGTDLVALLSVISEHVQFTRQHRVQHGPCSLPTGRTAVNVSAYQANVTSLDPCLAPSLSFWATP